MRRRARRSWRANIPQLGVLVIVLGALVLVLALVSDDDDGGRRDRTTTTTVTDGAPEDTTPTTLSTANPDLQAALVQLEDLPEGWTEDAHTGAIDELCDGRDPLGETPPDALSQTGFTNEGPVLSSVVAEYSRADRAEELIDAVRSTIEECGTFETDSGTFEISEDDAPDVGDEAVVADLTGKTDLGSLAGRLLYLRVGSRIAVIAMVGFDGVDPELVADAAEKVADRL